MHMALTRTKRWTLAELHRLPDDGNKYELVRGELFVTPAPSAEHETIAALLTHLLVPYVTARRLGLVYRPRAVVRVKRHSEIEPDLMVRQPPTSRPASWTTMPVPILVVEVISDSTRRRDHVHKRDVYMEAGIPEYWIIDASERSFTVVRSGHEDLVEHERVTWTPAGATQPLVVEVGALFREALG